MSETRAGGNGQEPRDSGPGPGDNGAISPAPAEIVELMAACRQYVKRAVGVELDLTPETLPVLDHYVQLSRELLAKRPQLLPLLAQAVGCYFGELVRRRCDLFWHLPSADMHQWRLCGRSAYLMISPIGVAYDALHGSEAHDGPPSELQLAAEEREVVQRRLANLPPVPEDEYYLLSTRLEVMEIAVDALRAQMAQAGIGDVVFDADDYESDLS